ncbi:aspartyl-phosphate phosphatase Spo0E family protein [Bacillus sp. BRMEA1]|nr:aspartyl-phosphate phosphatase Spo0E family protein [Neobacillus endophyticus]
MSYQYRFLHPETLKYSQELDHLLNLYRNWFHSLLLS